MLKKMAGLMLLTCLLSSSWVAAEEERPQAQPNLPQALSDAELDAITAGNAVIVILSNPGNGVVNATTPTHVICINCQGSSPEPFGIVVTPRGKIIGIPGGPVL